MLNRRIGSLKISQSQYEGNPLVILEGYCDKDSANYLLNFLLSFLDNDVKKVTIDIKNLHLDIKGNMAISKAHRLFLKDGGNLKIIKNSENVSKAMQIVRKKYFADSF